MAAEINCEGIASEQRRCPLLTLCRHAKMLVEIGGLR
jgi:hypothetical protein